jgi:hypothetical protein
MDPNACSSLASYDLCSTVGAWLLALGSTTTLVSLVLLWSAWQLREEARRRYRDAVNERALYHRATTDQARERSGRDGAAS